MHLFWILQLSAAALAIPGRSFEARAASTPLNPTASITATGTGATATGSKGMLIQKRASYWDSRIKELTSTQSRLVPESTSLPQLLSAHNAIILRILTGGLTDQP